MGKYHHYMTDDSTSQTDENSNLEKAGPEKTGDVKKLYSPTQAGVMAFFGGPLAVVYPLWKNFRALDNAEYARNTLFLGIFLCISLIVFIPYLPDSMPSGVIGAIYAMIAGIVASKYQMTKTQIKESNEYTFRSNWNVLGMGILCLVTFVLFALPYIILLDMNGSFPD